MRGPPTHPQTQAARKTRSARSVGALEEGVLAPAEQPAEPLQPEDMDGVVRLSVEEGEELYALALRGRRGELTADELPRWEQLLEKAADRPTGSIAAARQYEAERRVQDAEQAAAAREAERQRAVERERWLTEIGAPR